LLIKKNISIKNIIPKKRPIGKYVINFSLNSIIFTFNIIITNKNNTVIAPIYITKNNIAINSTPNNINNIVTQTNTNIKKNIECIGFVLIIIIKALKIIKNDKKKKINKFSIN